MGYLIGQSKKGLRNTVIPHETSEKHKKNQIDEMCSCGMALLLREEWNMECQGSCTNIGEGDYRIFELEGKWSSSILQGKRYL